MSFCEKKSNCEINNYSLKVGEAACIYICKLIFLPILFILEIWNT